MTNPNTVAISAKMNASIRNCATREARLAPRIFRIPTSLARPIDLAVARFM